MEQQNDNAEPQPRRFMRKRRVKTRQPSNQPPELHTARFAEVKADAVAPSEDRVQGEAGEWKGTDELTGTDNLIVPVADNMSADTTSTGMFNLPSQPENTNVQAPPAEDPPTPEGVELYRQKLETRLLERYNNHPEFAGRVAKVSVVLSKPLDISLDGKLIQAAFDQLVYDNWGRRLPDLEKEYYVVTFGAGGVQQVRSDPSIRVGLDLERTYSELAPITGDPFHHVEDSQAFKTTPGKRMPTWWRPDFQE